MWFAFFSFVPLGSHGYVQNRTHPKGSLATLYFKDLCGHCYRGKGWVTKDKEASSFRHTVRAIHELGSVFFFDHNFTLFFRKNLHEIIWTFDGFQSIFKGLSFHWVWVENNVFGSSVTHGLLGFSFNRMVLGMCALCLTFGNLTYYHLPTRAGLVVHTGTTSYKRSTD